MHKENALVHAAALVSVTVAIVGVLVTPSSPRISHLEHLSVGVESAVAVGNEPASHPARDRPRALRTSDSAPIDSRSMSRAHALEYSSGAAVSQTGVSDAVVSEVRFDDDPSEEMYARLGEWEEAMSDLTPDPEWDVVASALLTQRFNDADVQGAVLDDVSCRGEVCRLEIAHDDSQALDALLDGSLPLVPWNHRARYESIPETEDPTVTVLFVSREGFGF